MRFMKLLASATLATMLVACGGGGGVDGPGTEKPPVSTATSIEVLSSAVSLPSGSDSSVTITALVKNSSNNGIANEPVTFSADSGVLQSAAAVTGANGTAIATLAVGANKAQRDITVTVKAGSVSSKVVVPVSGTTVGIAGVSSLLLNGVETYIASVKDSSGSGVSGVEVTLSSSLGNTLSAGKVTTGANGTASFTYTATKSGTDTLTASGAGVSSRQTLVVNSVDFSFTEPASGAVPAVRTSEEKMVVVRYREGGVSVAGKKIIFSSTRGTVKAVNDVTDADGFAKAVASSTTAGPATISAQLEGSNTVTTTGINYFASVPFSITVQANTAAIPPNAAGTSANTATVTAIVRDVTGNPVQNATVNFTLLQDTSGGTISPGTGATDANGRVNATFAPGATSTAQNGVVIQAGTNSGALLSTATLTVSTRALFIAIATSNTIANKDGDETVYRKPFSVQVNDAAGAPVVNQAVTLKTWPPFFRKGFMAWGGTAWGIAASVTCANEDANKNGFLDAGEDRNGDGRLQPGIPGVISPATVTTDRTGFASFDLFYGEQYALWVDFEITAGATVAGTESRTTFNYFPAAAMSSDLTSETVTPAGAKSPFGVVLDCTSPD